MDRLPTRRAVLAAGAAGAGTVAVAVAACGGSRRAPARRAPGSPAAGARLVALDAVPVGTAVAAALPDGSPVVVARPTASTAACFSAVCTHLGCTVAPAGAELHCPCHGSRYNALTGAVLHGPAPRPLAKVPVRVERGEVVTSR